MLGKCGNPRSVRVSKRRGRTKNLRLVIPPARPRRAISTAKQRILPIFFEIGYSASPMGGSRRFPESRLKCTPRQILAQCRNSQRHKRRSRSQSSLRLSSRRHSVKTMGYLPSWSEGALTSSIRAWYGGRPCRGGLATCGRRSAIGKQEADGRCSMSFEAVLHWGYASPAIGVRPLYSGALTTR